MTKTAAPQLKDPLIHFPFYINQYYGILSRLSLEERGAFISLLCIFLSEDGELPTDQEELFRVCLALTDGEKKAVLKIFERVVVLGNEINPCQKAIRQCPHFLRHSLPPQIDEIPA